jgi:hypothetical protein
MSRCNGSSNEGSFIVKVQVSLDTNLPVQQVLVYNEDRSVLYQGDITPEIVQHMDGCFKAYFYAHIDGKLIVLDRLAPVQEW